MIATVGGLAKYISLYRTHNPVQKISLLQNWYQMSSYSVFMLIPFLIPTGFWIIEKFKSGKLKSNQVSNMKIPADFIWTLSWWLIPPLLFFMLFHYSKGYYLLNAIPMFGLIILFVHNNQFRHCLLGASIVLQILFFTTMPYSLADVETYISRQSRQLNLAEVWWARTKSVFLMASSHIRALDEIANEFETAFYKLDGQREFIFLDPTCPISARAIQAKYSHLKFTAVAYHKKGHFQLYTGLSDKSKTGFKTMLSDAVIASRTDFVNQYLDDLEKKIYHSGDIIFLTISAENAETLSSRYDQLFSRVR